MGITVVACSINLCGNNSRCVIYFIYCYQVSACKNEDRELGIYKAMGYTSSQLILQTTGSFIACVDGGNCDFKLFGNLLYAGYLSIYF